jgi:putative ABC transport system permease protein
MEKVWIQNASAFPFEYKIFEESFDKLYDKEHRLFNLFGYFSLLAILIACMGIAGLALYTAKVKTREISVRRVFGAPQSAIINLMVKEFMKWIVIAGLLAWPLAYYFMDEWLSKYAYRISIQWWTFALSTLLAAFLALSVVTFYAIKVASTDPSKALKSE